MSGWVAGATVVSALFASSANKKAQRASSRQAALDREERRIAREEFNKRIAKYEKTEYVPLDLDALRQESVYEDMDLSKDVLPAADYAKEQFQQQQANIMQGLRGVAGASGVAGLAQALSDQAAQQSRQQSISIGTALSQNRKLALQEKSKLQSQERAVLLSNMQGKNAFELDKMSTLMGVAGQKAYAAGASMAQNQQNLMQLNQANTQMWTQTIQSLG